MLTPHEKVLERTSLDIVNVRAIGLPSRGIRTATSNLRHRYVIKYRQTDHMPSKRFSGKIVCTGNLAPGKAADALGHQLGMF